MVKVFHDWGDLFKVEFSIKVTKAPPAGWTNVFHFSGTDKDCCNYGDRIPALWINGNGNFYICFSGVNGNENYCKLFAIKLNHLYHMTVQQLKDSGLYWYEIIIDGVSKVKTKNYSVKTYSSVKLYASDPWYNPFTSDLGIVSNLKIQQG